MSAKPILANAEIATNANIASGPQAGSSVKLDPGLATRQAGAVPGRSAPARWWNYWFHQVYLWIQYLSDGAFTGPHSVSNTTAAIALAVSNTDTANSALSCTMPAGATVAAGLFEGGLDVTIGDVASPTGLRVLAAAPIKLRDTQEYQYCDSAGAQSLPVRTIPLPLTPCPTGSVQWVSVCAAGTPGDRYLAVATPGGTEYLDFEYRLPNGTSLASVSAVTEQGATAGSDMTMKVYKVSGNGATPTVTQYGSTQTASDAGVDTLTVSSSVLPFDDNDTLLIRIEASNSGSGFDKIHRLFCTFGDPGPRNY